MGNKMSDAKPVEADAKKDDVEEEEEEEGCCTKCCNGYSACIIAVCKCIYNTISAIKNAIVFCCASWWYPLKERCCTCCDKCDKDMNPYKDPDHDPYMTI